MYTDENLTTAVEKGIFTSEAVDAFRREFAAEKSTPIADEEYFRLVNGMNGIFVVLAGVLFLVSGAMYFSSLDKPLAGLFAAVASWGLSEYFVKKKRMALPAVVFLLTYVCGVFGGVLYYFVPVTLEDVLSSGLIWAGVATTAASILHWKRFRVPVTIAAGTAGIVSLVLGLLVYAAPEILRHFLWVLLVCGVGTFAFAMFWDVQDIKRLTRKSDVAFWLHLLSAPLMIHPFFTSLSLDTQNLKGVLVVIAVYLGICSVSIVIDRRVFMVSALVYVLVAFRNLYEAHGFLGYLTVTGIIIGLSLLIIAAFWTELRKKMVRVLPPMLRSKLPAIV